MKTLQEILVRFEELSGRQSCLSEEQLQSRDIRELVADDVYALIDFDARCQPYVTHYIWFSSKENAIEALQDFTLNLSKEAYQQL